MSVPSFLHRDDQAKRLRIGDLDIKQHTRKILMLYCNPKKLSEQAFLQRRLTYLLNQGFTLTDLKQKSFVGPSTLNDLFQAFRLEGILLPIGGSIVLEYFLYQQPVRYRSLPGRLLGPQGHVPNQAYAEPIQHFMFKPFANSNLIGENPVIGLFLCYFQIREDATMYQSILKRHFLKSYPSVESLKADLEKSIGLGLKITNFEQHKNAPNYVTSWYAGQRAIFTQEADKKNLLQSLPKGIITAAIEGDVWYAYYPIKENAWKVETDEFVETALRAIKLVR